MVGRSLALRALLMALTVNVVDVVGSPRIYNSNAYMDKQQHYNQCNLRQIQQRNDEAAMAGL